MKKSVRGFTLVELLIVIAIIAVLAAIVVLIVNPIELTRRSRDAARLSDLANLQQAVTVAVGESTQSGTTTLCAGGVTSGACTGTGTSNRSNDSSSTIRNSDGTGWVKVNFSGLGVSIPVLPSDPQNTAANHYTYCSDGTNWEINARLESTQQEAKMGTDGGNENGSAPDYSAAKYEVGSNLNLIGASGGPGVVCQY